MYQGDILTWISNAEDVVRGANAASPASNESRRSISAGRMNLHAGVDGKSFGTHISHAHEGVKGNGNLISRERVDAFQHPNEFDNARESNHDFIGTRYDIECDTSLRLVVLRRHSYQQVCICCNLHLIPAQPLRIASFISSIVATLSVWPARIP